MGDNVRPIDFVVHEDGSLELRREIDVTAAGEKLHLKGLVLRFVLSREEARALHHELGHIFGAD